MGRRGLRHRAGYAWWRHAEARLTTGSPASSATTALHTAMAATDGHAPLLAEIGALARRARIPLDTPPTAPEPPRVPRPQCTG